MVRRSLIPVCATLLAVGLGSPGLALVIGGSSLAYGERVDLSSVLVPIDSGPMPQVSGNSPAPYTESDDVLSLNLGGGAITSGTLVVNATSDVDGGAGSRSTAADANVESLGIGGALATLLTLSSSTIASSAQVAGNGALSASGGAVLEDLTISVLGVPLAIPADPPANTVLFDAAGVLIVLNEQALTGDGVNGLALAVNALRIEFTNAVLGLGLLNGEIVISHSEAALSVLPEPSLALPTLAVAVALFALVRRRAA